MGEPVPILDLVHKYAAAVNVANVEIQFTGLRPGEKLNEKVFSDSEERMPTSPPEDLVDRRPRSSAPTSRRCWTSSTRDAAVNDVEGTLKLLRSLVPEYEPTTHEVSPAAARAPYPDGF